MGKIKRSKNKFVPESDIDSFCQGVEEILAQIRDRRRSKALKKQKKKLS